MDTFWYWYFGLNVFFALAQAGIGVARNRRWYAILFMIAVNLTIGTPLQTAMFCFYVGYGLAKGNDSRK